MGVLTKAVVCWGAVSRSRCTVHPNPQIYWSSRGRFLVVICVGSGGGERRKKESISTRAILYSVRCDREKEGRRAGLSGFLEIYQ